MVVFTELITIMREIMSTDISNIWDEIIIPEPTARSVVPGVSPGARVTNSARLFIPG